jgi:hypothetical protein
MAKTEPKNDPQTGVAEQLPETVTPAGPPALGTSVNVKVAPGVVLLNNETGAHFVPGVATPVTVTVTVLRRLADGDFSLA